MDVSCVLANPQSYVVTWDHVWHFSIRRSRLIHELARAPQHRRVDSLEQSAKLARREEHFERARRDDEWNTKRSAIETLEQNAVPAAVMPENLHVRTRLVVKHERRFGARLVPEHVAHDAPEAVKRQPKVDRRARQGDDGRQPDHAPPPTNDAKPLH